METKRTFALVKQIVTARNGWYSSVVAVYNNLSDAKEAVKVSVKLLQEQDPKIALRELDCVYGEKYRIGWCGRGLNFPLGQFIIISL